MSYQPLPKEEIELFKQLPDLKVIIDVGARDDIEYYTIYPEAEYHLFEPNPEFVQVLKDIVGNKPNVHINAVGIGDVDETRFYSRNNQAFAGGEASVPVADIECPLITLDRYVSEHRIGVVDFLKVDAEGYDFKVLLGATKTLGKTRFLQYEHWDNKKQYHALLGEHFDMEYVGFRNVVCMNKELVDVKVRNTIREYIATHNMKTLA